MMQNQSKVSRWRLNVIVFVILLPLLLDVQLVRLFTPEYIQMMAKGCALARFASRYPDDSAICQRVSF